MCIIIIIIIIISAQVEYDRHMVETLDGGVLALDVVAAAPGNAPCFYDYIQIAS